MRGERGQKKKMKKLSRCGKQVRGEKECAKGCVKNSKGMEGTEE